MTEDMFDEISEETEKLKKVKFLKGETVVAAIESDIVHSEEEDNVGGYDDED